MTHLIPYQAAIDGISADKQWAGTARIEWVMTSVKQWPSTYKFRAPLRVGLRTIEGMYVQGDFKASRLNGVPDRLYIGLMVQGARTLAVDCGPYAAHRNKVGKGMPYYMQTVYHPHIHMPVIEASYGYAEPLDNESAEALWQLFLTRANISGAPRLTLPLDNDQIGQLRLNI